MATVPLDTCPQAPDLLQMLLSACGPDGIGGSDRAGRTLFDIEEIIPHSCLAAAKPLIVQATMKAHIPMNSTKIHSSASTLSSTSSSGKENLYKEKDKDKYKEKDKYKDKEKDKDDFQPKMNMAVQAMMYQNKDRRGENRIDDNKIGSYNYTTSQRAPDEYRYGNISKSAIR
eukprot:CAMPEP_0119048064 /NCGR_PEP_ID=MMETSP1177-20130426/56694_1 /TAXON_ID=2985 /ORGANISM="Ochromonas sp, Strain CCMP1899" /LENGTH=171 /DNA_ID=CAMNT_0007023453 /DNA_START=11 /DNA_END=526 /DNA_ORIENTATION=-